MEQNEKKEKSFFEILKEKAQPYVEKASVIAKDVKKTIEDDKFQEKLKEGKDKTLTKIKSIASEQTRKTIKATSKMAGKAVKKKGIKTYHNFQNWLNDKTSPKGDEGQYSESQAMGSKIGLVLGGLVGKTSKYIKNKLNDLHENINENVESSAYPGFKVTKELLEKYVMTTGNFNGSKTLDNTHCKIEKEKGLLNIICNSDIVIDPEVGSFKEYLHVGCTLPKLKENIKLDEIMVDYKILTTDLKERISNIDQELESFSDEGKIQTPGRNPTFPNKNYSYTIMKNTGGQISARYNPKGLIKDNRISMIFKFQIENKEENKNE